MAGCIPALQEIRSALPHMDCIDRANVDAIAAVNADSVFDVSLSVKDLNRSLPAHTHTCFTSIASILIYYSRHFPVLLSFFRCAMQAQLNESNC
mgnify:CR=1 FL=1